MFSLGHVLHGVNANKFSDLKILRLFRLVESYRNEDGRVCHRTMLNAGYIDGLTTEQLNLIQKIITAKVSNLSSPVIDVPFSEDPVVNKHVDEFYNRLIVEISIDPSSFAVSCSTCFVSCSTLFNKFSMIWSLLILLQYYRVKS